MLPDTWLSTPFAWLLTAAVIFALLAVWAMIALVRAARARRPLRAVNRLLLRVVDGGEAVVAFTTHTPLFTAVDGYDLLVFSAHCKCSKN